MTGSLTVLLTWDICINYLECCCGEMVTDLPPWSEHILAVSS